MRETDKGGDGEKDRVRGEQTGRKVKSEGGGVDREREKGG